MPWTEQDVDRHNKGLSPLKKRQWLHVANGVLSETGNEGEAIRKANAVVREALVDVEVISTRDAIRAQRHRHPGYAVLSECARCVTVHLLERESALAMLPVDLIEKSSDEGGHPYGAWHGGKKSEGGGPGPAPGGKDARIRDMASKVGPENVGNLSNLKGDHGEGQKPSTAESLDKDTGRPGTDDPAGRKAWDEGFKKSSGRDYDTASPQEWKDSAARYPNMKRGDALDQYRLDKENDRRNAYEAIGPGGKAGPRPTEPYDAKRDLAAIQSRQSKMAAAEKANAERVAAMRAEMPAKPPALPGTPGGPKAAKPGKPGPAANEPAAQMASHADTNRLRLMAGSSNPDQSRAGMSEMLRRAKAPGTTLDATTVRSLKRSDVEHLAISSADPGHRAVARAELARRQSASAATRSSASAAFTGRTGAQMADRKR